MALDVDLLAIGKSCLELLGQDSSGSKPANQLQPGLAQLVESALSESRADYCMTKTSLAMMSKIFAARLASIGAASYDIRPGIMKTEMTAPSAERYNGFIREGGVPMRRWGTPQNVATCIATLARGEMPFTTGLPVYVDGGMAMHRI